MLNPSAESCRATNHHLSNQPDDLLPASMPKTSPDLTISERCFSSFPNGEWDDFVLACGGSFLGSWRVVKARRLVGKVRLFEFFADHESPLKLGQCAVVVTRGRVVFLDRIYLRAGHRNLLNQCFNLIIQRFGDKVYHYGSPWNEEERFEQVSIPAFAGKIVLDSHFHIDLIDFCRWANFPTYLRDVSDNIRRDNRKAKSTSARVETKFGLAAIRDVFALVALRAQVMRKGKVRFSFIMDYFRHVVKLAILGKNGFITTVRMERRCYSAFFGTRFGSSLYYISGGTRANRNGFGSYLFLTLIENWFATYPSGKFVMGYEPGHRDPITYTRGTPLYRRKLRVSSVNGVEFQLQVNHAKADLSQNTAPNQRYLSSLLRH